MIIGQPDPQQVADIIAINHLAASYSEAMCRFAVEEAVETYAEDGVLSTPTTEDAVGRTAIAETIGRTVSGWTSCSRLCTRVSSRSTATPR